MEGLIPFVIHAIKKSKERSKYAHLSEDSTHALAGAGIGGRVPWPEEEGSSRHRRTRSEFQPRRHQEADLQHHGGYYTPPPSDLHRRGLAPSRSLRDDGVLPSAAADGGVGRVRTEGFVW